MPGGPYVYLPLLGPGNVRDRVAGRVDGMAHPLGMADAGMVGGAAIDGVQSVTQPQQAMSIRQRASMAAESGETQDEYAMVRDLYYAKRAAQIEDAAGADRVPEPVWGDEDYDVQHAAVQPRPAPAQPDPRYRRAQADPRYARAPADARNARAAPAPRYAQAYAPPPPAYAARRAPAYPPQAYGYEVPPPPPAYRSRREQAYYERAAERAAAQAAADAGYWQSAYVGWDQ